MAETTIPTRRRVLAELIGLCGLAFTQPLLDVFGRAPEVFLVRNAGPAQVVGFAVAVALVPPVALWLVEMVVRRVSANASLWVHQILVAALAAAVFVQPLRQHDTGTVVFVVAGVFGGLAVLAYRRFAAMRNWVRYLAWAPVGFVGLFLVASPTSGLLTSDPSFAEVAPAAPAPVVMIVLDELPLSSLIDGSGEIDRDLFPNLAALADDAHWYRNATSVSPVTFHAVPAILTGQAPEQGEAPLASDHPDSLFSLLGGSYSLDVEETITHLCSWDPCRPPSSWGVLDDLLLDARHVAGARLGLWQEGDVTAALGVADDAAASFEGFIDGLTADPMGLHVKHILLPHRPYRYLPDGEPYPIPSPEIGRSAAGYWSEEPWPSTLARQRLILQMEFVDGLLGQTFDRLRDLGIYDDAVIIVTADHGISFDPGTIARPAGGQSPADTSLTDLLWVPLLVKEPGQTTGDISDANALTIDVVPTIADILGLEIPWSIDGQSLLSPPRRTADKPWWPSETNARSVDVGDEITVDGTAGLHDLFDRSLANFLPAEGGAGRIWRVGPRPELVGREAEGLPAGSLTPLDIDLVDDSTHALIRATGEQLERGDVVAVAIDGVIAATGVVFDEKGHLELAVMVDPDLLDGDGASVEVYRVI